MLDVINRNKQKITYFFIFSILTAILLLLAISFKNDEKILSKTKGLVYEKNEIDNIKKFLLNRIQSPFINVDYAIQKGDTIQKILKKFKIKKRYNYFKY